MAFFHMALESGGTPMPRLPGLSLSPSGNDGFPSRCIRRSDMAHVHAIPPPAPDAALLRHRARYPPEVKTFTGAGPSAWKKCRGEILRYAGGATPAPGGRVTWARLFARARQFFQTISEKRADLTGVVVTRVNDMGAISRPSRCGPANVGEH